MALCISHFDEMVADTSTFQLENANIYHKYHSMQDRDINITLNRYIPKLQLDKMWTVLDLGSGPGDITYKYLLPMVPENGTLLGIDLSESMVEYANSLYKDPRLSFKVMDATNPSTGDKYRDTFDTIFSFHCLHWIQDQKSVMKNIYNMLKPGGECLLLFLSTSPIYTMYENLACSPQWHPYMKDYKNFVSPYHLSQDPVQDVRNLLEEVGLQIKNCVRTPTSYRMASEEILYKSIEAVNPFLKKIPEYLLEDYWKDCKSIIWKENLGRLEPTKEVTVFYTLMTVHAYK